MKKPKDLLVMVSVDGNKYYNKKYCSTLEEALEWARNISGFCSYEVIVFREMEDTPILHYGMNTIWGNELIIRN